jgi:mono/diheme cytochrome c family protein
VSVVAGFLQVVAAGGLAALATLNLGTCRSAGAQEEPSGNAAHGRQLYLATGCFECHGRDGQGGAFNGPAPTLAHTELGFQAFKDQLRQPANDMPAYAVGVMSDQDVADLLAFVRALPGPRPPGAIAILKD